MQLLAVRTVCSAPWKVVSWVEPYVASPHRLYRFCVVNVGTFSSTIYKFVTVSDVWLPVIYVHVIILITHHVFCNEFELVRTGNTYATILMSAMLWESCSHSPNTDGIALAHLLHSEPNLVMRSIPSVVFSICYRAQNNNYCHYALKK